MAVPFILQSNLNYTRFKPTVKVLTFSKKLQHLEQKHPPEDRKAGEGTAIDDAVARELGIRLHLLRHGEAGDGAGCGKHGNERHELDTAKAKDDRKRKHDGRHNDEPRCHRKDELTQMCVIAPTVKGCTENDECNGRGRRRDLSDRLQHRRRDRQLYEAAQSPRNCSQDHGIHEDAAQDRQEVKSSAAKGLKYEHTEYIVDGNDDCNHHGRNRNRRITEDVADERNAHEDVIAAKGRLDHRTAPRIVRLNAADDARKDECREQHTGRTKEHEHGLECRPRIGDIDVVEHHEEEEHAEHHAIHMPKFFLTEKTRTFHENADRHQTEEGNDAAERDKKIAEHKKASPPIRLHYNRKEMERQRINALAQVDKFVVFFLYI